MSSWTFIPPKMSNARIKYANLLPSHALTRFDRIVVFLEKALDTYSSLNSLTLILMEAGVTGFAANFFEKINVLLGVEGDLVRGSRRDGSGIGLDHSAYSRTDEWVWRGEGGKSLKKVADVRDKRIGAW